MKFKIIAFSIFLILLSACMKQEFGGLGIEVPSGKEKISSENPYVIMNTFEGFPAFAAGLQEGDIILEVDGRSLDGLTQEYVYKHLLRGKPDSTVVLKIKRGEKDSIYQLVRQKIILQD